MRGSTNSLRAPGPPVRKAVVFICLLLGVLWTGLPAQEDDEEEAFAPRMAGIHIRLSGGLGFLSGGDFKTGIQGMYDWSAQFIRSAGYTLGKSDVAPFNSGTELGGDIVYYFAGRLGVGAGAARMHVSKTNTQLFSSGPLDNLMTVLPQADILALRLSVFYALPLTPLLTVCLSAGPASYSVNYRYAGSIMMPDYGYDLSQRLKAGGLGAQGGIGLEILMNPRLAFILEAQGRYARISGFEGTQVVVEYLGGPFTTTETDGTLYYVEEGGYPRLEVFSDAPPAGLTSRRAVLDLSGVSLRAGLTFKF
jgi:hypothetical protein